MKRPHQGVTGLVSQLSLAPGDLRRAYPPLAKLERILLATRDAHELYRRYGGFRNLSAPEKWMELVRK